MKKKLLFVIPTLEIGGTNKTLENYLSLINKDKYEVMLYSLQFFSDGYYFNLFKPYFVRRSVLGYLCVDNFITRKLFNVMKRKYNGFDTLFRKFEAKYIEKKYKPDVVIAFQEQGTTTFCSLFQNTQKIAWVHSFWPNFANGGLNQFYLNDYLKYDSIVCVSNALKEYFVRCFPSVASKCISIHNPLNKRQIISQSKEIIQEDFFEDKGFKIISVGHLVDVKQFHLIPMIVKRIMDFGCKSPFTWYILGPEFHKGLKNEIEKEIEMNGVASHVKLLGGRDNPYPFIAHSQLLVCTSSSESFSYVINEAKVLHVPVVSNDFPVSTEVVNSQSGWISNIDNMPELICSLIVDNKEEYSKTKNTISFYNYSNEEIMKKLDTLMFTGK